jgi:hypothetical protein
MEAFSASLLSLCSLLDISLSAFSCILQEVTRRLHILYYK